MLKTPTSAHFRRTGAAKCGGNYAGSMLAALEAQKKGFHNVLWLDGIERRYVEEAGLMNVVFVIDGTVITPPLGGTILPGITRDSVLTLLREMKVPVEERRITIDEVFEAMPRARCRARPVWAPPRIFPPSAASATRTANSRCRPSPPTRPSPEWARSGMPSAPGKRPTGSRVDAGRIDDREIWRSGEVVTWRSGSDEFSIW